MYCLVDRRFKINSCLFSLPTLPRPNLIPLLIFHQFPFFSKQMAEVTAWKNDFGKRARDKDALFASMTALINEDGATEDVEDVKKRMEDVDSLWDVLEASVTVSLCVLVSTRNVAEL